MGKMALIKYRKNGINWRIRPEDENAKEVAG